MKLAEYLKREGLTQVEFGRRLNPPMTQMHLSHIIKGRSRTSLYRALEIHAVTGGLVAPTEWLDAAERQHLISLIAGGGEKLLRGTSKCQNTVEAAGDSSPCGGEDGQ